MDTQKGHPRGVGPFSISEVEDVLNLQNDLMKAWFIFRMAHACYDPRRRDIGLNKSCITRMRRSAAEIRRIVKEHSEQVASRES